MRLSLRKGARSSGKENSNEIGNAGPRQLMVKLIFLAAAAGRAATHASVTAAVANHNGSASMATGRIAHVEILLHGVGSVKD